MVRDARILTLCSWPLKNSKKFFFQFQLGFSPLNLLSLMTQDISIEASARFIISFAYSSLHHTHHKNRKKELDFNILSFKKRESQTH